MSPEQDPKTNNLPAPGGMKELPNPVRFAPPWPKLVEDFLMYLAIERGLSRNYQISTRHSLQTFAKWADESAQITSAGSIQPEHFTEYLVWRKTLWPRLSISET